MLTWADVTAEYQDAMKDLEVKLLGPTHSYRKSILELGLSVNEVLVIYDTTLGSRFRR